MKKLILVASLLTLTACSDTLQGHRIYQALDLCESVESSVNHVVVGRGGRVICNNGKAFRGSEFLDHVVGSKEGKGDGS